VLADGVRWFDDWYAIERITGNILAIGEPHYHQLNWHYLIEGRQQALLIDTGPGERDIAPVVRTLTDKPLAALASHMHYDHTGNLHRFDDIWMADFTILRSCVDLEGAVQIPDSLHLGSHEDRRWIPVRPSRWVAPGESLELGGTTLEIIATPGHAVDHIAMYDRSADILFAADFIYLGELYAQVPGADLAVYLDTAKKLAAIINPNTLILGAHGQPNEQGAHAAPRLTYGDLQDLIAALEELKASGKKPERIQVNQRMMLLASPMSYSAWQA
jgi:hydroxyacylglutathione hydrolase